VGTGKDRAQSLYNKSKKGSLEANASSHEYNGATARVNKRARVSGTSTGPSLAFVDMANQCPDRGRPNITL
jgi:hypothetical protein